jgi:phage shock protein A
MDMEMNEDLSLTLGETVDRLAAAATSLEQTVERLEAKIASAEQKLIALEARAAAPAPVASGRKTLPTAMTTLLAKQGVTLDTIEAGTLDAALSSLSIEQRIAVKSQLIRAGLLS